MSAEIGDPEFSQNESWSSSQSLAYSVVRALSGDEKRAKLAALLMESDKTSDTTSEIVFGETWIPDKKIRFRVYHSQLS